MPTWPASLPQRPLAEGYQESFATLGIRFQPDAGPAIQRRRFTAGVKPFQVRLKLTPAQAAALEVFWETDTAGGALEFDWVHPRTGAAVTMRFLADTPPVLAAVNRGLNYTATFALEIMP